MKSSSPDALIEDLTLLAKPGEAVARGTTLPQLLALAAVALVLAAAVIFFLKRRAALAASESVEDPDVAALRELARWEAFGDPERRRKAVAGVSGTMRRYVEARFGLRAPRMTTEEFFEALRGGRMMPAKFEPFWQNFMTECDRIKYAGFTPDENNFRSLLTAAEAFVTGHGSHPPK